MKKFLFTLLVTMVSSVAFAQSGKVVVDDSGRIYGRYVGTNPKNKTFIVRNQDDYEIPQAGKKVVVFSAANGQGVVYQKNFGTINVRNQPSTSGKKVGILVCPEGYMPEVAECLGKTDGWYKIRLLDTDVIGYVREDLVEWDSINSF